MSCVVISTSIPQFIPSSATDPLRHETRRDYVVSNLAQSLQQHPNFVAGFAANKRWFKLLLAHHLARSLLEKSVLGDGVRACKRGCGAWDHRVARCDKSVFRAGPTQACPLRTASTFFKLSAVRLYCESVGVLLKDSTWTCISDASDEGSHAAAACTCAQ